MKSLKNTSRKLRLRTALVVPFILQIVAAVGLVGYLSFRSGERAINDIAAYMKAADEVGGDYYDVLNTDGVVTLGIGDVTGHGLESGILMLMAQTAIRTLKEIRETDPVRFLDALNPHPV